MSADGQIQDPIGTVRRLWIALGLVAPGGTAPCEVLTELASACENGTDPRRAIGALQKMLEPAWGDWGSRESLNQLPEPAVAAGGLNVPGQLAAYFETLGKPFGSWWVYSWDIDLCERDDFLEEDEIFSREAEARDFGLSLASQEEAQGRRLWIVRPDGSKYLFWDGAKLVVETRSSLLSRSI